MKLFKMIFGDSKRMIKTFQPLVTKVHEYEESLKNLSEAQLQEKTIRLRERLKSETLLEVLPEAFACVREASGRTLNQRHYDCQLIGGMVLHQGKIAEMRTGEGKTLTSTLPVYLNALEGKGVHVVTVNDYLARRDAVWMGQIYQALGMSVGVITHEQSFIYDPSFTASEDDKKRDETGSFLVQQQFLRPVARKEAYACDITYGTNNEFGFDYLRDNMVHSVEQMVQRPLWFAIVDEVDSILIDEARTPLIISAPDMESTQRYYQFAKWVEQLNPQIHYMVDEKLKSSYLTEAGIAKMEEFLGVKNIYTESGIATVHHIEQALRAKALYKLDRDYVIQNGEVIIVDEFTGRLMQGRRYSEGLHQAIEAKENVEIKKESKTLATITFQNYFRLYKKLAGMTGTATTEAEEFHKIYKLEVMEIPPHKSVIRRDLNDRIFPSEEAKFKAVVKEIKELHEKGQPVLVGTISIDKNEYLSSLLTRSGIPHQVLNAKQHEREAQIIAQAGKVGAVTIATNMAGRGVDIVLGGNPFDAKEHAKVEVLGGLAVLGTERHESRRIDNQLRGRSGRQGEPGLSRFYISVEDDLMRIFGGDRLQALMKRLKLPDDMPIENRFVSRSIESAQKRVEGHNFDIRKRVVEYDDVMNKQREVIYKRRREFLELFADKKVSEMRDRLLELVRVEIEKLVAVHTDSADETTWEIDKLVESLNTIFPFASSRAHDIKEVIKTLKGDVLMEKTKITDDLVAEAKKQYLSMEKTITQASGTEKTFVQFELYVVLQSIDTLWIEHLDIMNYLRKGIGLRGYGQRDPLLEYKKEAYTQFMELLNRIDSQIVTTIYKMGHQQVAPVTFKEPTRLEYEAPLKEMQDSGFGKAAGTVIAAASGKDTDRDPQGKKMGRNDVCWCGSGKKYKKCHGA